MRADDVNTVLIYVSFPPRIKVSGGEMFEHLTRNGPYSEATASGFMRELAAALCFLHSNEIIHADLKPENLMLSSWDLGESKLKVGGWMISCSLFSQIVPRDHI